MQNLYYKIYSWKNMLSAWRKARKGKTKKNYVMGFEKNLRENLKQLRFELMTETYFPQLSKTFILRDPKTRVISKSDFRDRIVHHALINIIQNIFERSFIYDSCANQRGKGNLFAISRFDKFKRKVTSNLKQEAFCLKADIKHYFQEVNHEILFEILQRKIKDEKVINLIVKILQNSADRERERRDILYQKACLLEI
ncbi:MAG: reverse transcriptase domain-containing protein [Nanoarchaeota archaeon]